jgi:glycosyltransferase involved in cell wall biosynthesis
MPGETVFVDDGSTDGTWAKVVSERTRRGNVPALQHRLPQRARRLHRVPAGGLQSDPAEDIPKLVAELEAGVDVVCGRRIGRREGKLLVSLVYNFLCRRLFGVDAHDLNWIKAFRRDVIEAIRLRSDWHRYVVVLAAGNGFRVKEIPTSYYPRHSGRSKFGRKRILRGLLDLLVVKFELTFKDKPMLLFGSWGLALLGLGTLLGVVLILDKIFTGIGSRPGLYLVMLLVMVGVQLLGLGFVSEQIAYLLESLRGAASEGLSPRDRGEAEGEGPSDQPSSGGGAGR